MSRAFKQHMQSADPREVVAKVHQRRPTSVALRGSKLHMLNDILEEDTTSGTPLNAEESFLAAAASNSASFMQNDLVAKFSRRWLDTQINLLIGVIGRIGTE